MTPEELAARTVGKNLATWGLLIGGMAYGVFKLKEKAKEKKKKNNDPFGNRFE